MFFAFKIILKKDLLLKPIYLSLPQNYGQPKMEWIHFLL